MINHAQIGNTLTKYTIAYVYIRVNVYNMSIKPAYFAYLILTCFSTTETAIIPWVHPSPPDCAMPNVDDPGT